VRRRELVALTLFGIVEGSARAQQADKTHRIAVVHPAEPTAVMSETGGHPTYRAFFEELRRLGYIEGRNLVVERWSGEGRTDQYRELARQIVGSKPDVIYSSSGRFIQGFKDLNSVIPIVANTADPVGYEFAASLAHPGGHITGVSVDGGLAVSGKYFELLRELNPAISRVGIVCARETWDSLYGQALRSSADRLGISIVGPSLESPVSEVAYLRYFETIVRSGAEALVVTDSPENFPNRRLISALASNSRLPAIYPYAEYVRLGGFISYGVDLDDRGRRSASYVDKILRGARAGDLPVEQPTKFELVINTTTARKLGLTIPPTLLARADEVIE
jgi:putative ABC transport system substrate-binding protein